MRGKGGEFTDDLLSAALGAGEVAFFTRYQYFKVFFTGRASILVNRHKGPFSKTLDRITGYTG
jgi:hypothetical protein